jgi:hypothetical protein
MAYLRRPKEADMQAGQQWYPGHLREMSEQECRELLEQNHIGRVAWCDQEGPVVLPVNYRFEDDAILFRTSPHSELARHFTAGKAAFQIDAFDEYSQSGWSVLLRGRAELLDWDETPDADHRPEPWADGVRNVYVRIPADRITGRRVLPS